ncbi:MAG TPA: aminomethyl-transferring glycine dehydrogenase subunit GcvPB [Alphaproteobacteria bacterium]|nr:aminomethyl-transferring glycine dehydrogenase subunit GcvPB [Alphaproteobacteria bacterium]
MQNLDEIIGQSRGLKYEEKLLFEQSSEGACGVDLQEIKNFQNKTGQQAREKIGLAQVSEPQVVRHFVRLSTQNYSIDHGIFPLGSCTMKHNPRLNEKTARFDGFANLHPMQSEAQTQGALALMCELQNWLKQVSGLDAIALSPAAGAHGELAGIMTIHAAHVAKGNPRKTVIVPDSAHGTNPATAALCGYEIVSVPTEKDGKVNPQSVKNVLNENVAAIMLTNPNTCGLYESGAHEIADALHKAGAYFYCDGANFNAIVGKVQPAKFGVDVMHFNLHKTFSTPHGGGGPGSGPIAVCKELEPYIPTPYVVKEGEKYKLVTENKNSFGRLRGFNGQFGMFVRALTYMLSHGGDGLKQVAEDAVLNANYIRSSLKNYYNIPFDDYCMHEFLMNDKLQKDDGVTTMDIAKTMVEYGIHPMTVYFPLVVQAAMLIEPTETENKQSLDRLIAVLQKIAIDTKDKAKAEAMHKNPVSTPRRRLDEVKAAKELKLKF